MGRSAADTPTSPEFLRVSDVDRDRAIDELKKEFVDGRLSHDTFMMRMHAALGARNSGQLSGLLDDLPPHRPGLGRIRAAMRRVAQNSREMLSSAPGLVPGGSTAVPRGDWEEPLPGDDQRWSGEARPAVWPEGRLDGRVAARPAEPVGPAGPPVPLAFPRGAGTTFTIGRHRDCDLYIADMSVSRVHAQLERNTEGWLLADLGSTNGTRLNGWRVRAPVLLQPGDQLKFGNAEFVIQGSGPGEAPEEDVLGDGPLA
jgi:FHA domain/DUF1707 SHOCT-like domain